MLYKVVIQNNNKRRDFWGQNKGGCLFAKGIHFLKTWYTAASRISECTMPRPFWKAKNSHVLICSLTSTHLKMQSSLLLWYISTNTVYMFLLVWPLCRFHTSPQNRRANLHTPFDRCANLHTPLQNRCAIGVQNTVHNG